MDLVPTAKYGFTNEPVAQPQSLYVPRPAVLLAGENSVVYVETEPGRFEIRPVTVGPILRDKIVILEGLKEGENVATAGNFLIDSQMQLAGKPSLIDPTRAVAKRNEQKGPLVFAHVSVNPIEGRAGEQLEALYQAYTNIQQSLASDKAPPATAAQSLHFAATSLAGEAMLSEDARKLSQQIASESEHLHHMDLASARKAFKPISHAILQLATQARSDKASSVFTHFYCPMVPGGGGDWLQANGNLLNPYYGSEMLRCGEKVEEFPLRGEGVAKGTEKPSPAAPSHDHAGGRAL
jgi:Cu(I)/Ag(I) efflux system membrane fusion protein